MISDILLRNTILMLNENMNNIVNNLYSLLRRTTGMPLIPLEHRPLDSRFEFAYPVHFSDSFKNILQINYATL